MNSFNNVTAMLFSVMIFSSLLVATTTSKRSLTQFGTSKLNVTTDMFSAMKRAYMAILFSDKWTDAKRGGLDLGIGRGLSASQAAKHRMGNAAANYIEGPGKRSQAWRDE